MSENKTTANPGRFRKGKSGNPAGRPRGSISRPANASAFEILLDKTVPFTKNGKTREISIEEALEQRTFKDALAGKRMAIREVLKWINKREAWFAANTAKQVRPIEPFLSSPDPDNADEALMLLGIAAEDPYRADWGRERVQLLLEPWAVEMALRRKHVAADLTQQQRTNIEQRTRDGQKLTWPDTSRH